jgi:hypothetical protein
MAVRIIRVQGWSFQYRRIRRRLLFLCQGLDHIIRATAPVVIQGRIVGDNSLSSINNQIRDHEKKTFHPDSSGPCRCLLEQLLFAAAFSPPSCAASSYQMIDRTGKDLMRADKAQYSRRLTFSLSISLL